MKNLSNFKPTKRLLSLLIVGLFFLSNSIFSQDFQLASNNKTIICDNASVGSSGVVNGKTFTKVDRNTLVSKISNGDDVSCVCTSGITNMQGLFQNNQNFNQDISSWDTSSVSNMQGLFQNAGSFNQDIGYWDVSSMNDQNGVNQLFDNAGSLNQDLSYWCFPNNQNIYNNRDNIWGNNNPIKNNSSLRPRFSGRSPVCRDPKIAPDQNANDNTPPTVTISSSDDDNLLVLSDTVTITATFTEAMAATPTISIAGTSISAGLMTKGVGSFIQLGGDIDGEAADDSSGNSVSLSSDGSRVAIGAFGNDGNGSNSGHVRIYSWNGSAWNQVGADIDGDAESDNFGWSISLSSDGSRVAIGAYLSDGIGPDSGHTSIYDYDGSAWVQVGADIDGEAANNQSGRSVSLSSDGSTVAIGTGKNGGNGLQSGHVRIYSWSGSTWTKLGADIDGEARYDNSGWSVSLSSDGSRVAIGAWGNDGNGDSSGHVRIYSWSGSTWTKLGADIDGEAEGDYSGYSVSLSSDGTRVAIGADSNDGNG
ncbi:MAG: BspA family leucine-rich repeat surface protein, partial [Flavobacteriaceae bacterium]